ncbi:ABC-type transport auxiliary lipoprotein family protein [Brevundimonas sp.]|uniref:ABC-type transport auxiliary lipoprotein family protein n=1 Tax=Brevundimonas sp. TaxID=1871086 RepID=UPI0035B0A217
MTRALPFAATAAAAIVLSGCALLSTPDPVQLYRFGSVPAEAAPGAPSARTTSVAMRRITFPDATRAQRILGVTGSEAAYIGGARWVSDADTLFTDNLQNAFAERSRSTRIIGRQELTPADVSLDLDVRSFEARYEYEGAAPTVVIAARGRILGFPDRQVIAERNFSVSQPAGENRVSAIVQAFDVASRDINTQIIDWTDQVAASRPPAPPAD